VLFTDYILTPAARFDYPSPSAAFLALVERHRPAVYEAQRSFFDYLSDTLEHLPAGGPLVTRSAAAPALEAEPERQQQSESVASIPMFSDKGMRWNAVTRLTRREALESIRARLSNPELKDGQLF